jgi:hypothetical protein
MKQAWIAKIIAVLVLAIPAWGQIRGVPASVTSFGRGRGATPGPPASVTSLGPNGFSTPCIGGISPMIPSAIGCTPTQFTTGFFFPDPRDRGRVNLHSRRHDSQSFWPVYVPYAYPYPVAAEPDPEADAEAAADADPPAPTIFERRATSERAPVSGSINSARSGARYVDPREQQQFASDPAAADPAGAPAGTPAREQIPIVLIYRDGHQQEVSNYAIVGQTLYDLGTFVARKIPLADLNLKATIKANDDRGVEFSVPTSVKVD